MHYDDNYLHTSSLRMSGLHELILYVYKVSASVMLHIRNVGMNMFDLGELLLRVSEGHLSVLLCNYNVNREMFDLHAQILYAFAD